MGSDNRSKHPVLHREMVLLIADYLLEIPFSRLLLLNTQSSSPALALVSLAGFLHIPLSQCVSLYSASNNVVTTDSFAP